MAGNSSVALSQQALSAYPTFVFSPWVLVENWGQIEADVYPDAAATEVDVVVETDYSQTTQGIPEVAEDTANTTTVGQDLKIPLKRNVWIWSGTAPMQPFKIPLPNGAVYVRVGVAGAGSASVNIRQISSATN